MAVFSWQSASRTDVGKIRDINEDSLLDNPEDGLWVVADGMGGHDAGDVASQMIVASLTATDGTGRLSVFVDSVEESLLDVNRRLIELARSRGDNGTIGSTVVALLCRDDHAVCLWAGDSRLYRLRDGVLRQITRDHSHVEELIDRGELLREDAENHPASNVITRAIGADSNLCIDADLFDLRAGDRYLLCSDGLYKELSDADIGAALSQGSCGEACADMVSQALGRGCRDNVTVVVVDITAAG